MEAMFTKMAMRVPANVNDAVFAAAHDIHRYSNSITPKDTGELRSTSVVNPIAGGAEIRYVAPYAIYVHENLEVAHPHHAHNPNCHGQAKFLHTAILAGFKLVGRTIQAMMLRKV